MRAIARDAYGPPSVLEVREVERPAVTDDGVLVRVSAASINPVDWHTLTGMPYLVRLQEGLGRPKSSLLGVDFAGSVEAVGGNVEHVAVGDEVFGGRSGAFAEYVNVEQAVVRKPANLGFEEAAAVPVAGVTALQGLRDKGGLEAGQKVLVNGASGGVGTFAVQIAKALGAEVTGVCSTRNLELVGELGADHVIDYTRGDFTRGGVRYDVVLDAVGNRSWMELKRVLADGARLVVVGGPTRNRWIGPLGHLLAVKLASAGQGRQVQTFLAKLNRDDLVTLTKLLDDGVVRPAIDRRYELADVPEALTYLGEKHARGKLVVSVRPR